MIGQLLLVSHCQHILMPVAMEAHAQFRHMQAATLFNHVMVG
jgi:hypothetical protein